MPSEIVCRCSSDNGTVAIDKFQVEMEARAIARGSLTHPKSVIVRVIGTSTQLIKVGVDLPNQCLVAKVDTPNRPRMGIAAINILPVVGHVAKIIVRTGNLRNVEFVNEIAVEVVFVKHRQHCR